MHFSEKKRIFNRYSVLLPFFNKWRYLNTLFCLSVEKEISFYSVNGHRSHPFSDLFWKKRGGLSILQTSDLMIEYHVRSRTINQKTTNLIYHFRSAGLREDVRVAIHRGKESQPLLPPQPVSHTATAGHFD